MAERLALRTRNIRDQITHTLLLIPAVISASFVLFIVIFIVERGVKPFLTSVYGNESVNLIRFLTGNTWYVPPSTYGVFYIVINTVYVVFLASFFSVILSVITALFIARMTTKAIRGFFKTVIELLAAIPSIIYGVFGLGVITKFVIWLAGLFGTQTAGGISALSTILVLAIMIYPTVTLMSVTSIDAVDQNLEKGSLALGATKIQTYFKITLLSAKSGIFSGVVLGIGRALGEATAVSMVAGNAGTGPSFNIFSTTRTLTSTMLLGLKETSGVDYDIRFSVGIVLIVVIFLGNAILNHFKKKVGKYS